MFTILFTATFIWFTTAVVSSMVNCIKHRKAAIDSIRYIATHGTVRDMKSLCKGNPKFVGYSRLNKAELSAFILARI